jgi:copper chaperone CopZ
VYGNCEICKNRIEKAAKGRGVMSAIWDVDAKLLSLDYDPSITSPEKVQQRIAGAGHDTQLKKAKDFVYNELPDCCHYREKKEGVSGSQIDPIVNIASQPGIVTGVVMEMDDKGNFHPMQGASVIWLGNGQRCNDRQ